ncbi:hypothetical protein [Candidatus Protofrankia californiensis]|uniref:hypothetical protein n=1 Tax=Candidatus Protofrankia californiensis TaxID=1839754 RepID=UPI0010411105|nr:hypothetical protein [Candidatus Protofrankia californiensis]
MTTTNGLDAAELAAEHAELLPERSAMAVWDYTDIGWSGGWFGGLFAAAADFVGGAFFIHF